jgi:hypothetical protein
MARWISVPMVDAATAERVSVSPHEVEQRKREREQQLATLYVACEVTDPDAFQEVIQMLGLDGEAQSYLTGPMSPDATMSSRSVRSQ